MTGMRRWLQSLLALALVFSLLGAYATAGEPGTFNYRGGDQGKVVFDHRLHAAKGYGCRDCHTAYKPTGKQLFQTQRQGFIDMAAHDSGNKCFACHNDKVAFNNCAQCHRK